MLNGEYMKKPIIVSSFSGAGGIDIGFDNAGFETIFASDIWDVATETLKKNFKNTEVVTANIEDIDFKKILDKYGYIDGFVGGPPCPPFSKSRFYRKEKKRGLDDEDGFMTVSNYFRAVEELNPKFYFFENVHGFVFKPHKDALELLEEESERLGYKIFYEVINTADYGVPQTRQRFICVGVKKELTDFVFPDKEYSDPGKLKLGTKPWKTAGDVLSDIDFDLPEDMNMQAGSKHKDLLKEIPPGDNYLYFTEKRGHPNPKFKWRSRYWSFLLKLSPDRPSWTIQASFSNNMGPFHWKNRFLRINEIKRIQTFDDNYYLHGSFKDQWRQIGNAVPPLLVEKIAKQIFNLYYKEDIR
jgi:DNA (cytosine-5)-methyltransferase 1